MSLAFNSFILGFVFYTGILKWFFDFDLGKPTINSQLHFSFQINGHCRLVLHSFSLPLFSMTQYVLHLSSA